MSSYKSKRLEFTKILRNLTRVKSPSSSLTNCQRNILSKICRLEVSYRRWSSNLSGHNLKCRSNNGTYVRNITIEKPVNQTTGVYESVSKRIQPYFKETSNIGGRKTSQNLFAVLRMLSRDTGRTPPSSRESRSSAVGSTACIINNFLNIQFFISEMN